MTALLTRAVAWMSLRVIRQSGKRVPTVTFWGGKPTGLKETIGYLQLGAGGGTDYEVACEGTSQGDETILYLEYGGSSMVL